MIRGRVLAALALAVCAMFFASSQVPAATRGGGNRDLERVFEKGPFREPEAAQIARAFKVAVDAGVEERDALGLVAAAADGEFGADQVVRMLTIAAQLSLEHLPTERFVSKVREGVAKRVAADRIVQAAERQALTLKQASNLLKQLALEGFSSSDREELLPDVAEALAAGIDQGRIREIIGGAVREGDGPRAIRRKLFP